MVVNYCPRAAMIAGSSTPGRAQHAVLVQWNPCKRSSRQLWQWPRVQPPAKRSRRARSAKVLVAHHGSTGIAGSRAPGRAQRAVLAQWNP
eukprot:273817-Rhodomonas_salina.1